MTPEARASGASHVVPFSVDEAYADHAGVLYGFVVNAVGDRADAEDLVQEVFTRAWRASSHYDPDRASVRTWLFAIARNLVLDAHRARSRRPRVIGEVAVDAGPVTAGPEDDVVDRVRVVEALARLSPEHREVVAALHLDGRTYAELAASTGVAVPTLRTRMFYGLRAMRSILEELDEEGRNNSA
ncbi:sigma-70 family RNA polymerase sigma factor [Blastococcus sp. CT_GayMR19]|uniref:RNA polymerase sigma factor n=1 Tax=Blastococcus sp. CT_GayMR19 TaxID=2559608 RepID=UPI001073FE04|nr:sigma-70 family RNA polymerase sigma factor [Blastococcus sp. CT_GayMR19]TFV73356.1 sigma-70 family RNA polymerase sigma factor [Blastococcus sp. CT_GayMR19]